VYPYLATAAYSQNCLPAVAMNGWHVTHHWAAGDGGGAPLIYRNGVNV